MTRDYIVVVAQSFLQVLHLSVARVVISPASSVLAQPTTTLADSTRCGGGEVTPRRAPQEPDEGASMCIHTARLTIA